jgi:tetratricopeptide (TPR) repeat protein
LKGSALFFRTTLRVLFFSVLASMATAAVAQTASRADAIAIEQQGRNAEAEQAWRSIATADPKNAEAFAHLGLLESRREDYEDAISDYRKALELAPSIPNLQLNLGLALFKTSQYPAAVKAFSQELKKHPGDSRLLILLGMSHYAMRDYLVAIPYLQKAAESDPQNLPLRLAWAHSCLWSKQYECVLAVYKQILGLNADSAEADMLAGEALDEKGDDAGAIEQFRAAIKANPAEPNVHFGLGYLLWKEHHFDEAAQEFKAELALDRDHQQARAYLGDSLVEMNQYDQALAELETAANSTGTASLAMVHRDLGIVYAEAGRNDEAAAELLKAVALDPKDISPHWRLGKLYQAMGKKEEAKAEFNIASAMNKEKNRPLAQELGEPRPGTQP